MVSIAAMEMLVLFSPLLSILGVRNFCKTDIADILIVSPSTEDVIPRSAEKVRFHKPQISRSLVLTEVSFSTQLIPSV